MTEQQKQRLSMFLILVVASVFVIGIGAQAWFAQREDAKQDRQDRKYANCLTRFATDLVDSLEVRTEVSTRLNQVRDRKDALLDRLIVISLDARNRGAEEESDLPPRLIREYEHVLKERVEAQEKFTRLKREFDEARNENPYQSPTATCQR